MKGWRVSELGEPCDAMSLDDLPDPVPGTGQLLVRVLNHVPRTSQHPHTAQHKENP